MNDFVVKLKFPHALPSLSHLTYFNFSDCLYFWKCKTTTKQNPQNLILKQFKGKIIKKYHQVQINVLFYGHVFFENAVDFQNDAVCSRTHYLNELVRTIFKYLTFT